MIDKLLPSKKIYGGKINHFADDDFIDRLNNRWTVRALIMCIFVVSGNMLWLKHIICWTPNEFLLPHIEYANSICWLKGSYYLPTEEITIPDRSKPRVNFISYYQWTPFILLGMTILFLFPRFLWHACPRQGGVNIRRLVQGIKKNTDQDKGLDVARQTLKLYLDTQNELHRTPCCNYVYPRWYAGQTLAYLSIKLLYLINTICQFILLNHFLSFEFTSYGIEALKKMFSAEDGFESSKFPRVTMCDFMVRRLGSNQHWYSVQCNLPFNMYNEKIFLGIWIWLIFLTIFNILSIISWLISLSKGRRLAAVRRYLKIYGPISQEQERLLASKTTTTSNERREVTKEGINGLLKYLNVDGYLIFRLIGRNTDEIVAGKIIKYLYDKYEPFHHHLESNV